MHNLNPFFFLSKNFNFSRFSIAKNDFFAFLMLQVLDDSKLQFSAVQDLIVHVDYVAKISPDPVMVPYLTRFPNLKFLSVRCYFHTLTYPIISVSFRVSK